MLFPLLVDHLFINKQPKKCHKMSQLGKTIPNTLNKREVKAVKNQNKKLTPKQIFEQLYGLRSNNVKSETNKPPHKNSNFLNNAHRYCLEGMDDSFKRELHYISTIKHN